MSSNLKYLLQLIDDEDEKVFLDIKVNIIEQGFEAKEALLEMAENLLTDIAQQRIEILIEEINYNEIKKEVQRFVNDKMYSPINLWAFFVYFTEREHGFIPYQNELLEVLKKAWIEIDNEIKVIDNAKRIHRIMTKEYHFDITDESLLSVPDSFYLHQIILSSITHCFTFKTLLWMIAYQCGLPLSFVRIKKGEYLYLILDTNIENLNIETYALLCENKEISFEKLNTEFISDENNSRLHIIYALLEQQAKSYQEKGNIVMQKKLLSLCELIPLT